MDDIAAGLPDVKMESWTLARDIKFKEMAKDVKKWKCGTCMTMNDVNPSWGTPGVCTECRAKRVLPKDPITTE